MAETLAGAVPILDSETINPKEKHPLEKSIIDPYNTTTLPRRYVISLGTALSLIGVLIKQWSSDARGRFEADESLSSSTRSDYIGRVDTTNNVGTGIVAIGPIIAVSDFIIRRFIIRR